MSEISFKSFRDEIRLSRLGMGNMRLPVKTEESGEHIDYEKAKAIIDRAMEAGINYYDTAYIYHGGESERFLGRALAEYPRDRYYVADKFNYQANPDYRAQFAEQLERLSMDFIDFYLLHGVQDYFVEDAISCGCIEYFDQMKKVGKIRYLGFSFHGTPEALKRILSVYPWDFVQIQLNYYDWLYESAKALYEILDEAGIPIMVMEPVHGGMLADLGEKANGILKEAEPEHSIASWAMRWVKSLPRVQVILSGMSDLEQLNDNIHVISETADISEEEQKLIEKACAVVRSNTAVPCTKCRYCTPNCPMELDIPYLLSNYNDAKIGGGWRLGNLASVVGEKLPSACIACGTCTKHCPQSFDIPKYMAELADMMKEH
ncbi:MAG: aldo/keto reductase [Candidatus Limivivens sp.]|nr:aldo/keto reductase [Candidatus Limivivens sp.]